MNTDNGNNSCIGLVPPDWDVNRIRYCIDFRQSGEWGLDEGEHLQEEICIRVADFDYDKLTLSDKEYTKRLYTPAQVSKYALRIGDLLIEKSGGGEKTPVGRVVLFNKDLKALYANFMEAVRLSENHDSSYFNYLFFTMYAYGVNKLHYTQTTGIQNLNIQSYFNEFVPTPSKVEQQAIADFLDEECGKINSIVVDMEEQIRILQLYKKSVITEAVTKGLDKAATMKDSGIEWIGDIPIFWQINKIKYCIDFRQSGEWGLDEGEHLQEEICIRVADFDYDSLTLSDKEYTKRLYTPAQVSKYALRIGDLLIEKSGGGEKTPVGRVVLFNKDLKALYANFMEAVRLSENHDSSYFNYLFFTMYAYGVNKLHYTQTTGIQNLNIQSYFNEFVPTPNKVEQHAIADFLDEECGKINSIVVDMEEQIRILQLYKKSLIYEYVTGKKRVKGVK